MNKICWVSLTILAMCSRVRGQTTAAATKKSTTVPITSTCSTPVVKSTDSTFPKGLQFTSVSPASIYEGSIVSLKVVGTNLDPSWTIMVCPTASATKSVVPNVSMTPPSTSPAVALTANLSAPPGTVGLYDVRIGASAPPSTLGDLPSADASAAPVSVAYDTNDSISINASDDTKYVPCAAPGASVPTNINLQCSFSPYSYNVTYASFGKGVADRFVAVYVNVQNKNQNLEYLLQDVRGGFNAYTVSSYDKQVPQDVSIRAEQLSARAIIFRLTAASASVLTGVAGFAGSAVLQEAANIFAGPAQTGLQSAIPDLSTAELSNLNQLGFSVASTVIPKGSAIKVVAFFPSETLSPPKDAPGAKKHHRYLHNNFKAYTGEALQSLFQSMTLEVAGTHVQEVTPSPTPTLKLFVPPLPTFTDFTEGVTITIEGTGLDSVTAVNLVSSDGKTTVTAKLQAVPGAPSNSIDPNVDQLVVTKTPGAAPGKYEIYFVYTGSNSVDTGQSVTIPSPPTAPIPAAPAG